jgi:putative nucleotidyltransferase with HDIG domain
VSRTLAPEALGPAQALLAAVAEALEEPAWLVGGAVRDALLGQPVADLDLALPAGSVAAAQRLADRLDGTFVPLGEPHGTARVVLRRPVAAVLDLTDFRGPDLEADLRGRDVTIDALAVPVGTLAREPAAVVDPTGGLADLAARRLRACGPTAFADDALRVLRLLRLAAELGFAIEAETGQWARGAVPGLAAVSAERVRDELTRIWRCRPSLPAVRRADEWGVIAAILPESEPMRTATQSAPHRFTVWEHSLRALEGLEALLGELSLLGPHEVRVAAHLAESLGGGLTRREVVKVATLLHDVGKPETRSVDPDGRVRFSGHDRLGAERAAAVAGRWRWPGRAAHVLERLVRQHLRPMHLAMAPEVTRRARYRFFRDLGEDVPGLICLTIADAAGTNGRPPSAVYRGETRELLEMLLAGDVEAAREAAAPPLLRGEDVMDTFRLDPGPEVGRLLARAREAQALGRVRTREQALDWLTALRRPDSGGGETPA